MSIQLKTLSLCALVAGALFLVLGFHAKGVQKELAEKGVSVPGTITNVQVQSGSKGKKNYFLLVTWGEGADQHANERFKVKKDFFTSKIKNNSTIVSPAVTVRHLPGKEGSAVIEGGTSDFGGMEWLGGIIGLVGVYGVYRGFVVRRPAPQA